MTSAGDHQGMRLTRKQAKSDTPVAAAVTIRRLTESDSDRAALRRLAELDSGTKLGGQVLVAEVEGSILAAIAVAGGEVLADPFSRTAELRSLLELRAAQLRRRDKVRIPRRLARRERATAALPSSPPGAGGRLLQLP
jgi:hypothetical protein